LLNEALIDALIKNKTGYVHYPSFEFERRLRFSYDDLQFIDDLNIYSPLDRNKIRGIYSIDISEGLGQDYSVINMFKIVPKPMDVIEAHKKEFVFLSDFFCLQQFGIYRSNLISVKQLAELFYVLSHEYFNPDNFKTVLEYNTYGGEFLAHLPYLFDGHNEYGSSIFFRYKHRIDSEEERIGIKVGSNKEILVKDYQDNMNKKNFIINNVTNVDEITTFVKHITPSGNIRYAADTGNDDTVMTIVNASSVFSKFAFREMVESYAHEFADPAMLAYFNDILKNREYTDMLSDYSSLLNVRKNRFIPNKDNNSGYNTNNWYSK
jgi:hypothetical protein